MISENKGDGPRAQNQKVRIRSDLHARIKAIVEHSARHQNLSQSVIVEQAIEEWLAKSQKPGLARRATIEPMDKEEEILVEGFLRLLQDRRPIAEVPRTGVLGLIKNWVDKARAARKEENHAS